MYEEPRPPDSARESRDDSVAPPDGVPDDQQALHHRLLADGASWRRSLGAADGVIQRARRATGIDEAESPSSAGPGVAPHGVHQVSGTPLSNRNTWQERGFQMNPSRSLRSLAAGMAAVAVVALLALLFYALAASHGGPAVGTQPRGATSQAAVHGAWRTNDALTFTAGQQVISGSPAISVSDPSTVYEASLAPMKLRRTTDAGKNWTDIKVPGDTSNLEDIQVFVSPLDAKSVFLTLTTPLPPSSQASACPTLTADQITTAQASMGTVPLALTRPRSGQIPCSLQYHSADGGATWRLLTLPVRAALADHSSDLALPTTHILRAQGSRLYAAGGCGPLCMGPGDDIVTSSDDGASWTLADHDLRAAGYGICDFTPSPAGTDVFALASKQGCDSEAVPPLMLWHSADAGAHWTQVGAPPSNLSFGMAVVEQTGGTPLLYIHMPQATAVPHTIQMTNDPSSLKVSADGGKTWKSAPLAGVLTGAQPSSGPIAVLSDGTVVEAYSMKSTTALYGWRQGDTTWRQVATPLKGQLSQLLVVPQAGADELVAVTGGGQQGQSGTTYTVQTYIP